MSTYLLMFVDQHTKKTSCKDKSILYIPDKFNFFLVECRHTFKSRNKPVYEVTTSTTSIMSNECAYEPFEGFALVPSEESQLTPWAIVTATLVL